MQPATITGLSHLLEIIFLELPRNWGDDAG